MRTKEEYDWAHIKGFANIPVDELREHLDEIDTEKPVYLLCESGIRGYIAVRILAANGYKAYNLAGGYRLYDAVINERCILETATACGRSRK